MEMIITQYHGIFAVEKRSGKIKIIPFFFLFFLWSEKLTIPSILTLSSYPHHAQYPLSHPIRKSRRPGEKEKDPTIEYLSFLDDPRKATFWKGGAGRWFGRRKEWRVGRRAPFFVDRRIPTLSVCRHRRLRRRRRRSHQWWWWVPRDRRAPPRLGRPRLVAHYRPPPSDPVSPPQASMKARLRPRAAVARADSPDQTEPRRRAATTHYWFAWERTKEPESREEERWRVEEEQVGLVKGGGRVVGWSRDGAYRRVTRQGLGEKRPRPWSGSAPPPTCQSKSGFRAKLFS